MNKKMALLGGGCVALLALAAWQGAVVPGRFYTDVQVGAEIAAHKTLHFASELTWLAKQNGLESANPAWLYCLAAYGVFVLAGSVETAARVVCAVSVAAAAGLALWLYRREWGKLGQRYGAWGPAGGAAALGAMLLCQRAAASARLAALPVFVAALWAADRLRQTGKARYWAAAVLLGVFCVNWNANVFPLLFGGFTLTLLPGLLPDFQFGRLYHRCAHRPLAILAAVAALGASGVASPFGLQAYDELRLLLANATVRGQTAAMAAVSLRSGTAALVLALLFFVLAFAAHGVDLGIAARTLFAAWCALQYQGALPYFCAVLWVFGLQAAAQAERGRAGKLSAAACAGLLAAAVGLGGRQKYSTAPKPDEYLLDLLSRCCIEQTRLYCPVNLAGYLQSEGFVPYLDSRFTLCADALYYDSLLHGGLAGGTGIRDIAGYVLDAACEYDIILAGKESDRYLAAYLAENASWNLIYEEGDYLLYGRNYGEYP